MAFKFLPLKIGQKQKLVHDILTCWMHSTNLHRFITTILQLLVTILAIRACVLVLDSRIYKNGLGCAMDIDLKKGMLSWVQILVKSVVFIFALVHLGIAWIYFFSSQLQVK